MALGENPSVKATSKDGNMAGLRVGYAKGPLNAAVTTARTRFAADDVIVTNFGGSCNLAWPT